MYHQSTVTVPNPPCCPCPGKSSLKTPVQDFTLDSNRQPVPGVTLSPEEEWKDPFLGSSSSSHFVSTGRVRRVLGLRSCGCPKGLNREQHPAPQTYLTSGTHVPRWSWKTRCLPAHHPGGHPPGPQQPGTAAPAETAGKRDDVMHPC